MVSVPVWPHATDARSSVPGVPAAVIVCPPRSFALLRSAAFPASARLHRPQQFRRVFRDPLRSRDECLVVLARANDLNSARLGMAISRKLAGNAVQRNRVRRVIRESFRRHRHLLPPADIVVTARQSLAGRSNTELRGSLEKHWHRLAQRWQES